MGVTRQTISNGLTTFHWVNQQSTDWAPQVGLRERRNGLKYPRSILSQEEKTSKVSFDIDNDKSFDGRVITAHYETTILVGAYSQCGGYDDEKKALKHKFDKAMKNHCAKASQENKNKEINKRVEKSKQSKRQMEKC